MLVAIKNPLLRTVTAAFTALSIVTIGGTIAIAVTKSNHETGYKTVLYSSLAAAIVGGALGLSLKYKEVKKSTETELNAETTWKDWQNLKVVRKVKESEEITSFYLKPEDRGELPNYQPGQFLTIKLDIPEQKRPIVRTYSLSDYNHEYYRLSIKREGAPKDRDLPPGVASNFMHDRIEVGSIIPAKPPSGKFVLDPKKSLPAVLISNGVGITPMIAMAKAVTLLNRDRQVWFLHGARSGKFHAFRDEMLAVAQKNPNLHLHYCYSQPSPEDEGHYQSTGYTDAALVEQLVQQEAEYFLCGSPAFMKSLREGFMARGIPESRVFFESFSKERKETVQADKVIESAKADITGESKVEFAKSEKSVTWNPNSVSLLDFAEENDLNPDYSCRAGVCGTCMCKLLEGEVTYLETPTATIDEGSVLICISKPKTAKIVLDL
ncbi:2Fe-2S iron-sulfur cluster-binding protein [Tumidithrix helvetica PCC 7403]|uniref:2Fe-2S iron-sulfur cluster-binding protein n=1 Tax=Tumidithrix helvetica TaxID=3457545 RepID=UPI003C844C00